MDINIKDIIILLIGFLLGIAQLGIIYLFKKIRIKVLNKYSHRKVIKYNSEVDGVVLLHSWSFEHRLLAQNTVIELCDRPNQDLIKEEVEKELFNKSQEEARDAKEMLVAKNYIGYLNVLLSTEDIINRYFESIMVIDKDEVIKNNRLSQLNYIATIFNKMVNLTLIEEKK